MTRFVGAGRWSRGRQLPTPQYSKIELVKVAYPNDDQTSFQQPPGLLQACPNLKGSSRPDRSSCATRASSASWPRTRRVGCVKAFMQLAGTHAAVRRVGHVDGSCFADPRQRRSARQANLAPAGQAPDVAGAGCSAGRTPEGPAPAALAQRSGAGPGTQRGPCEPSAPRTRLLWALARA
jgi:hypothetical protein